MGGRWTGPVARRTLLVWLILALVGGVGVVAPVEPTRALGGTTDTAGDLPETALQGQVPGADQANGRARLGYRKGTRLVGANDIQGRGNNFEVAFVGNCAYVGSGYMHRLGSTTVLATAGHALDHHGFDAGGLRRSPPPDLPFNGVAVVDASDPRRPKVVRLLQGSAATWNPWEGVITNETRGVLAVSGTGETLDFYDVSGDCTNPVLASVLPLPNQAHEFRLSADGMTAYVTDLFRQPEVVAVDLSDLKHPQVLSTWSSTDSVKGIHAPDLSPDGTRAYLANYAGPENGLIILDTTEIQERRPNPKMRELSRIEWPQAEVAPSHVSSVGPHVTLVTGSHGLKWARIGGRSYVLAVEEAAVRGWCPWAGGRIIDITDETQPRVVSKLSLEVNDPANCESVTSDGAPLYTSHQVTVDDPADATMAFVSWLSSGVRIFDIRDPAHPREIAYYNPPARPEIVTREYLTSPGWDTTASRVWYRPETGHIWFASFANGFQIIELTVPKPRTTR